MKTWHPPRTGALLVGALLLLGLAAVAGGLAWLAVERLALGYDLLVFIYGLGAGAAGLAALLILYQLTALLGLRYTLARDTLTIRWGGLAQVVPLARIETAALVGDLPPEARPPAPRGLRWPGLWVGRVAGAGGVPILAYASAPPPQQVLLLTPSRGYLLSPPDPAGFLAALAAAQSTAAALSPNSAGAAPSTRGGGLAAHPLPADRLALALAGVGLALNLLLFAYLALTYARLPDLLALHWNIEGYPDGIVESVELLRLPVIALGLWLADFAAAGWLHRRDRPAALLLYAGGAVVQVVFWAAVLTVVLRAT